ncbi:hypothetical protein ACFV1H_17855 [Streptomyces virginiae]|uniref:hypothetical protein n=1 Tax=Streptomyces virginiae TaxID=1961 RepID=UPI0036B9F3A9
MTDQPARHTADTITDDELDELYAEREQLLSELDGRSEAARERWIQKQLDETGLKSMDFRNGATMDLEPARDMVAQWVGAARTMLGDAPNYSETPIEMIVKVAEAPERFAFILQRVGKLTPHEARQQAEAERDKACLAFNAKVIALEKAEATITRIRKLADDWAVLRTHGGAVYELRAALDGQQEPRPPAVHIGKGENAENCIACRGTNPPYPFLCPGQPEPGPACADIPNCDGDCCKHASEEPTP